MVICGIIFSLSISSTPFPMAALGDDHRKMQEMFFGTPLEFNA
jgi:hypothetical protein